MPEYVLTTLPCWSHCGETFLTLTEMQAHHLDAHERALHGQPVAVWLAQEVTAQPLEEVARETQSDATAPPCRQCARPVSDSPDHRRLQLCTICACLGLLAHCATCGENYPEHGPGGRGCATWIQAPTAPFPGLKAPYAPPRRMFQVGVEGDAFYNHAENEACAPMGCIPVEEELPHGPA